MVIKEGFNSARASFSNFDKNSESNPSSERRWINGWKGEGDSLDSPVENVEERKNNRMMPKNWISQLVILLFMRSSLSGSTQFFNHLIECVI